MVGAHESTGQWIELSTASHNGTLFNHSAMLLDIESSPASWDDFHTHPHQTCLLPLYLRAAHLLAMDTDVTKPIVMIAAGTGIAPFIGFLQHRHELRFKCSFDIDHASGSFCAHSWMMPVNTVKLCFTSAVGMLIAISSSGLLDSVINCCLTTHKHTHCNLMHALTTACRGELEAYVADGTLTRLEVAFSRDAGARHHYVQDCIRADAKAFTRLHG